jgi:hypothetical protein
MKTVTGGDGSDTTAAVIAWLAAGRNFVLANLFLIGEADDPLALWLTDWESPLSWPHWGVFQSAVIARDTVTSAIGLNVESLAVTWSPKPSAFAATISAANPFQLARMGYYDNWRVRVWTVYMPTPGDANTFGCSELFGGRIADTTLDRGVIKFSVNSFLDVVNQMVPNNVIELLNTAAAYAGATPPPGFAHVPQFDVIDGSTTTQVVGDQTYPVAHSILGTNNVKGGYLVFNGGPGTTLGGVWSAIQQNILVSTGGIHVVNYNQFILYAPLPWTPTPGVDTFYVSGASPIDQSDGSYLGFPYVPDPSLSL